MSLFDITTMDKGTYNFYEASLTNSLEKSVAFENAKKNSEVMLHHLRKTLSIIEAIFDNDPRVLDDKEWEEYISAARYMSTFHNRPDGGYPGKVEEYLNELPY